MPAEPTRRGTKRDVHETTTCCAYREYPKYVLPEDGSDDIQIPDIKLHTPNLGLRSCATDFGSVNLLVDTMPCTNILVGTLFSVIRQTPK